MVVITYALVWSVASLKDDKILLKGLLAAIVLISFSGLVVFGVADDLPTITYKYPGKNSYYDITITYPDLTEVTYSGWCADATVYVDKPGYTAILVSSCGLEMGGIEPEPYEDDENWKAINYLMNEWNSGSYSGAIWVDIQQAIWYYADFGSYDPFTTPVEPYNLDSSEVQKIIDDVDANWETYEGPPCSTIIVHNKDPSGHQLLFFMIPEIPLGTIGAGLTMLSAFIVKRKRTKTQ